MPQTTEDWQFAGQAVFAGAVVLPSGSVTNSNVLASTGIDASKLDHNRVIANELYGPAVTIAALTKSLYCAQGAGTILGFDAWIEVVASDVSRTVNVDLQKSTAGGAWTTVMSSPVAITSSTTVRTLVAGTVSTPTYIAGDMFRAVVTVAGASGTQATGLTCRLRVDEAY